MFPKKVTRTAQYLTMSAKNWQSTFGLTQQLPQALLELWL